MSGTRFGRSGRCRFFISLGALVLMFGMVAIFQSSQQQLDETREQRIRCEQQQEALNVRLQSIVEQKYNIEKSQIRERNEQLIIRKSLEQKLKEQSDVEAKEQMEARDRYAKLQHSLNLLQNERTQLTNECISEKKRQSEEIKTLEDTVKSLRSELDKEKKTQDNDIVLLKEKYTLLLEEKTKLESLLNSSDTSAQLILKLKQTIAEYSSHCDYKPELPFASQMEINKPISSPETTRNSNISRRPSLDEPQNMKSFSKQVLILPKALNRISDEIPNQKMFLSTSSVPLEHQTEANKLNNSELKFNGLQTSATPSNTSLSLSKTIPNHRKLPDNVAPIPANFDDLLSNYQKVGYNIDNNEQNPSDVNAAVEDIQKPDNDNNRYTNVVNDLDKKEKGDAIVNEDSGAHEIKDRDFNNDQNANMAAEENNNFFDGDGKHGAADEMDAGNNHKLDGLNDDDDILGLGMAGEDIAVKNKHNLLDADNLKNEVMADQGKEFPDGLRLEDGNEEDDDDDYSNPGARQQGAQAIRN